MGLIFHASANAQQHIVTGGLGNYWRLDFFAIHPSFVGE
jgi:hypothetical protein